MALRDVIIAGGGVGGLEAALALRALAGDRVEVRLIAPDRWFTYKALSVEEPMGLGRTPRYDIEAIAAQTGFAFRSGRVKRVDAQARQLVTEQDEVVDYDDLVLAVGARPASGLRGALMFGGSDDAAGFADELQRLRGRGGGRVVFVVPRTVGWTLPLYELALLTADWAKRQGVDLDITVVTREGDPLEVFGKQASVEISGLLSERGISVRTASFADEVEEQRVFLELEGFLEADLVVSLPRLIGPAIGGLPHDADGFVKVDEFGRVPGAANVYAVGDMTTRPLKQGGLTAQQADVVASDIAARAGRDITVEPYRPVLRGLLFTGKAPRYLRRSGGEVPLPPSVEPLWWPGHKVAAAYLSTFLEAHPHLAEFFDQPDFR